MTKSSAKSEPLTANGMVPKQVQCRRCKGQCTWHSARTGIRAKTAAGPLVDSKRKCPECNGTGTETVYITAEQHRAEKEALARKIKAAKAEVDRKAAADKAEIEKKAKDGQ